MRLIDADALIKKLCGDCFGNKRHCQRPCYEETLIKTMPTIEAEQKHGRWLYKELRFKGDKTPTDYTYECSACGYKWGEDIYHYCPNCGAKMDEVTE